MGSLSSPSRDWCSLPEEIWSEISYRLAGDRFSITRLRSVCQSFRSIVPKFTIDSFISLPRFSFSNRHHSNIQSFVALTTVFKISRQNAAESWIIKLESTPHRIRLLDPLSLRISDIRELSNFDLSQFQMSELARAYTLRYVQGSATITGVEKVVLSPISGVVFTIFDGGRLGFAVDGDKDLTPIESRVADYNDIALFRGQPYVVDRWGTVSWIDVSMRLVQYSPPLADDGARKHLVVSSGEIFVVERYLEESNGDHLAAENRFPVNLFPRRRRRLDYAHPKSVDFKVFKLDEEWGRWVEMKNLGETSFILTYDSCFSIRAHEFNEFEPNRIYFTDQFDVDCACRRLGRQGGCVFNMELGTIDDLYITPGYSNIMTTDP